MFLVADEIVVIKFHPSVSLSNKHSTDLSKLLLIILPSVPTVLFFQFPSSLILVLYAYPFAFNPQNSYFLNVSAILFSSLPNTFPLSLDNSQDIFPICKICSNCFLPVNLSNHQSVIWFWCTALNRTIICCNFVLFSPSLVCNIP